MKEWDHCRNQIFRIYEYINPDLCHSLIPRLFVKPFVKVPDLGDLLSKNQRSEKLRTYAKVYIE